jgi:hypothetical protein
VSQERPFLCWSGECHGKNVIDSRMLCRPIAYGRMGLGFTVVGNSIVSIL